MSQMEEQMSTTNNNNNLNPNVETFTNHNSNKSSIRKEIQASGPHMHYPVPNPAPLGLFAFGFTTALLQMKHTRLTGASQEEMVGLQNLVWGFAIFYGGLLQFVAGLCEIRRNNVFGFTVFLSYGGFWMSFGTSNILVNLYATISGGGEETSLTSSSLINPNALQAMFILMGIFTFTLWICTLRLNITISLLIFFLMMTFFLLAGGVNYSLTDYVAGWFGLITSAIAFWLASAELINDIHGGGLVIIPLGQFKSNEFHFTHCFHVPGRIHGVTRHAV